MSSYPTIITRKSDAKIILLQLSAQTPKTYWPLFKELILDQKVKFPILEFIANNMEATFASSTQRLVYIDRVMSYNQVGSYVISGILLKHHLTSHFSQTLEKLKEYIIKSDNWEACDLMSERVLGEALLLNFKKAFSSHKNFLYHQNDWIVRSFGVASHYAVKKGLDRDRASQLLNALMHASERHQYCIQQGIGWGIKTIARFHPPLIHKYLDDHPDLQLPPWLKRKIDTGLWRYTKKLKENDTKG